MSIGVIVFLGIGLALVGLVALQLGMAWRTQQQVGKPAPKIAGPLADAVRGDALLFFHSPSCGPCRAMAPAVDQLARTDSRVHSVDVTRDFPVAQAFGVMATPTTIAIKDGTISETRMGAIPAGRLHAMLEAL